MKRPIHWFYGLFIIIFLISGCSPAPSAAPTAAPTAAPVSPPATGTATQPPVVSTEPGPAPVQPTATVSVAEMFRGLSQSWRVADYETSQLEICAMDADGSNRFCSNFSPSDGGPQFSWSPAGDQLVVAEGSVQLAIWKLGQGVLPFIKSGLDAHYYDPAWSPDGKYIAYASDVMGRKADETVLTDIFMKSVEGGQPLYMTSTIAADNHRPMWSPDGRSLAFISAPILKYPDGSSRPSVYDVYILDVNDHNKIVNLTRGVPEGISPQTELAFSPDGLKLAFLVNERLFIWDFNNNEARQATGNKITHPGSITWAADGQALLIGDQWVDLLSGDVSRLELSVNPATARWLVPALNAALSPMPARNCAFGWTRLYVGLQASVDGGPNDPPNRVRAEPKKSAEVIYQIYPQTVVTIMEGPVCADGLVYWKVSNPRIPGGEGWTAEGDGSTYWLVPIQP